jgi:hypothetical protein
MTATHAQSSTLPDAVLAMATGLCSPPKRQWDPLRPLRNWLDQLEIRSAAKAHWIAKLIPAQCPFERDLKLFGHTVGHIPPLCKLNPLYEQMVGLRFRALCYLVDQCGEDIQSYC